MNANRDDTEVRVLTEKLKGMAGASAILHETAKAERQRVIDTAEQLRVELREQDRLMIAVRTQMVKREDYEELEKRVAELELGEVKHASSAKVHAAIVTALASILASVITLLVSIYGRG